MNKENNNGMLARIEGLQKEVSEVKTTVIRHKDELLTTMQTYMNAMKEINETTMETFRDLMMNTENHHQENRRELKAEMKEINRDMKRMMQKLYWIAGIVSGVGVLSNKFI